MVWSYILFTDQMQNVLKKQQVPVSSFHIRVVNWTFMLLKDFLMILNVIKINLYCVFKTK